MGLLKINVGKKGGIPFILTNNESIKRRIRSHALAKGLDHVRSKKRSTIISAGIIEIIGVTNIVITVNNVSHDKTIVLRSSVITMIVGNIKPVTFTQALRR